ncbi:MAG: alpha/beta hydrolase [Myxococcales bacterium]|nr:MAG: alpha/beta hydrolase [Myxococcales bacterium]
MQRYADLLRRLGPVRAFDYPYMKGPGRKAPDKLEALVAAHRAELAELRSESLAGDRLLLAGKSMGGRIGCHVALESAAHGCICFGYPLRGQNGKLRDQVLLELRVPVLFVQGTRDELCDLGELEAVRARMSARSELHVVDTGNHSLEATKTSLKARGATQAQVEDDVLSAVRAFCESL